MTTPQLPPIRGHTWQHTNGIKYVVLYITNTASVREDHQPDVVYATAVDGNDIPAREISFGSDTPSYHTNKIWSRPLSDWHRSFTRIAT